MHSLIVIRFNIIYALLVHIKFRVTIFMHLYFCTCIHSLIIIRVVFTIFIHLDLDVWSYALVFIYMYKFINNNNKTYICDVYVYMFRAICKFTQFWNCAVQIRNSAIANQFQNGSLISKLCSTFVAVLKFPKPRKLRCRVPNPKYEFLKPWTRRDKKASY